MRSRILFAALLWLLLASCRFLGDTVTVAVHFPRHPSGRPGAWSGYLWTVEYPLPGGERAVSAVPGDREVILLRLPRGINVPVIASHVPPKDCPACPAPFPAGAIFPLHCTEPQSLPLAWEHGLAAQTILTLFGNPWVVETINTERFCREIVEVSGGDPWILDLERARYALLYGGLTVYAFRELPSHDLALDLSPGTWIFDDPLREPLRIERGGSDTVTLRRGFSGMTRMSPDGGFDDRITVSIDGQGYTAAYTVRGYVSTGSW